eukprot:TRINITY_DN9423_c1_g2_i1.p1 TRINITY_DN9423_c1_g2~~TRINITY_DN9423_c1_g2_i1.p1  ORF type:complete len:283 (+),score=56.88 TRINITY_DN9423_c1_g2_i1:38-850(+)
MSVAVGSVARAQGVNDEAFHDQFRDTLRDEAKLFMSMSPRRSLPSVQRSMSAAPCSSTRSSMAKQRTPGDTPSRQLQLQVPRSSGCEAFKEALKRKYGSIVGAWRVLDPLEHGRISFGDLCRASRQLGYICDAQCIWQALDVNKDGFVTIEEIDYSLAELLFGFALTIIEVCGSADSAWRKYFGGSRVGRCNRERFVQVSEALGYDGDGHRVFEALNADKSMGGVLYKDFRLLDKWFREIIGRSDGWRYDSLRPTRHNPDVALTAAARGD